MSEGFEITKETFRTLDTDKKLDAVFDVITDMKEQCYCRQEGCEKRFEVIEKRKWFDRGASGLGGVIGGFIAVGGSKIFKFFGIE